MTLKARDITLDATKGFLILCIVLEHNSLLVAQYDWIRPFCDAFAAGCFLLLSFLWPIKENRIKPFLDKYLSYLIPFFFIVLLTSIANFLLFKQSFNFSENSVLILKALLLASPFDLKQSTGFMYIWFLPCLCCIYLIRYLQMKMEKTALLSAIVAFCTIGFLPDEMLMKLPFSLHVIAIIYLLGIIYPKVHYFILGSKKGTKLFIIFLFLVGIVVSIKLGWQFFLAGGIIPSIAEPHLLFFYGGFMLIAIPSLYLIIEQVPLFVQKIMSLLGNHSLKIYLFHPIVFVALTQALAVTRSGYLSLVLTVVISLLLSLLVEKIKFIDFFVFPKKLSDLRSIKGVN